MKLAVPFLAFLGLLFASCRTPPPPDYTPTLARFFIESPSGTVGMTLPQSGVQVAVSAKPVITEFDFVDVAVAQVELGRCLMFQLAPAAARDLYRLSVPNQGRRLVLVVNGTPLGARRIERPLDDGAVLVFVELPDEALPGLAANLRKTTAELQRTLRKS
jgi:hypothetical protein